MINGRKSELLSLAGFCIFHHREVMVFMAEKRDKYLQLDEVIQQNKGKRGAVMMTLQAAQNIFEHVPRDVQVRIAEGLEVPLSEVYGVATFYSQFSLEPKGQYVVGVCLGTACYVKGSQKVLDKLSEANREQIQSYISTIWDNIAEGIAESRGISVNDINHYANEGLFFADPVKTVECGFIDELKYKPEVEAYVKELAGQNGEKLRSANLAQMKTLKASPTKNAPEIAVLYAEGEIKAQTPGNFYDIEQSITEKMADELIKLKNNDDVKAVVFRVNSPGGSAYISEQIWRQVVELKKVKPVVVSMGNVAASGGYYISCAANKIIAEPNTLTGSIGIFGMFPNASGLFGKLALTTDIVKTNTFSDLGDLSRPMTESEKALIQGYVERGYQTFLSRCAEGRGMTTEAVNAIGQGRVWTGEQAKERGLVDELGGIELAISTAAGLADLDQYSVTPVSGSKNFLDEFLESQLGEVKLSIIKNVLGNEFEYFKTLNNIKTNCGIQARMPYDMKPL